MSKIRWGVLSTAKIAREKLVPAMQKGKHCEIVAIASSNKNKVMEEAKRLNIPVVYFSYEELLNDPEIDAVYIPLPNHLHVEWSIKALEAGKHVLCEKPIALSANEADKLLQVSRQHPHLKIMEAFMYRFHPQWTAAKKMVNEKKIGELKTIQSFFSYHNVDPNNIRNQKEKGGGGLMDIGCYCISLSRFLFDREPKKLIGLIETDPVMQTDRLSSAILDFEEGSSTFTCSTQLMPYQRVNIIGTEGRIEIEMPFNPSPDSVTRIQLHLKTGKEEIIFDAVDQYTIQGEEFSKAIINNTPVPTGLDDAVNNMKVIEALFRSAGEKKWIELS